jgi:hypothetical protein
MKKTGRYIGLLVCSTLFSCGPSDEKLILDAYNEIVKYSIENRITSRSESRTGLVNGGANFTFGPDFIKVNYFSNGFVPFNETETGDLKDLYFSNKCGYSDCSGYKDMSIRADWDRNANFSINVADAYVKFHIFAKNRDSDNVSNFEYSNQIYLLSTDSVVNILKSLEKSLN